MTTITADWMAARATGLRRARAMAIVLFAIATATAAGLLAFRIGGSLPKAAATALAAGLLAGLSSLFQFRGRPLTQREVAEHLNRTVPGSEESAQLLLGDPATLSLLQRMQRQRVASALARVPELSGTLPDGRRRVLLRTAAALGGFAALLALLPSSGLHSTVAAGAPPGLATSDSATTIPALTGVEVTITPPAYTGRPARRASGWEVDAEEGARIRWQLSTRGTISAGWLVTTAGDTVALEERSEGQFAATLRAGRSTLYRVLLSGPDGVPVSGLDHRLTVQADAPPVLTVVTPDQRVEVRPGQSRMVELQVLASDDHGVDSVVIVATVTQGQGEGVKFREQQLDFATRERRQPAGLILRQVLDLSALGMEPGDELYFHVLASDHRAPSPNQARSETIFVTLVDSSQALLGPGSGVTLDLPPDFFRSQRQLIIDTEKLIRDQPALAQELFRGRSNDLGLDQGLLRLRYGQFMGDEFEGELVASGREEHAGEPGGEPPPEPTVDPITGVAIVDPMAELFHDHDNPENATLLAPQIKAKLREAISQMWSAELHLRLARPRQSLPFQERALELLQEIRQDARSYVRRVGFDPPPLEPDRRRLAGDLTKIRIPMVDATADPVLAEAELRRGLAVLQRLGAGGPAAPEDLLVLEATGQALGRLAVDDPARLLEPLRSLRLAIGSLQAGGAPCGGCLAGAEAGVWLALPEAPPWAVRPRPRASALAERFLRLLDRPR